MPKRKNTRKENGSGSIRKRKDGRWEGRYSVPAKDGCGSYIRKSVYGDTQDEVRMQLTQITGTIDEGTYIEPSQYRLSEWINIWLEIYVKPTVKDFTYDSYYGICKNHIIPNLGNVKLKDLTTTMIQKFYNSLLQKGLSTKTVKGIHGIFHRLLKQAFLVGEIKQNPTERCILPKVKKPKIEPLEDEDITRFLEGIKGHRYENVYFITLFTGLRQGEVLGLSWDCVNFQENSILINKQLRRDTHYAGSKYIIDSTKNDQEREITVAPSVMMVLEKQRAWQEKCAKKAGSAWNNEWNLVFTNELGEHLSHPTVYKNYKAIMRNLGIENKRFHDLRHTYAVAALESGDDIKTLQGNLGHATASFTLDRYGHVSKAMRQKSAMNMQQFINKVS